MRQITGPGKQVLETRDYLPFGRELSASEGKLQFTGHERDSHLPGDEDDLDYMHTRYYTPRLGRFLSTDPARSENPAFLQGWNRYAYAVKNPLKFLDPDERNPQAFRFVHEIEGLPEKIDSFNRAVVSIGAGFLPGIGGKDHIVKALERSRQLGRMIASGTLSETDQALAQALRTDLQDSLNPLLRDLGVTEDELLKIVQRGNRIRAAQ